MVLEWSRNRKNFLSNKLFKDGTYYIKVFNVDNTRQYIKIEDEFWNLIPCPSE